ncbi:hypothetical protein TBLA_0F04260 [Henningerozyma blattae CBS 6284]|uniref:Thioredoxin domain-containing protein n=1 Tax=Henningerozyma blattae (strain ATCC 34711 / CBS 6284 / DSM 70876 / NBRC 10599 / NRRL Y-10934 / UCD 77-7) TaxID=1071380 RepID=I2H6F7_HENB6|nr:hypothetical protein TBLA_0F04260 [Tetrapisispora blattae CBS 6284]CCH61959.1 hypothetical protein TBLA_0F04260 [Tetrapisispora blattae CBS 6284]
MQNENVELYKKAIKGSDYYYLVIHQQNFPPSVVCEPKSIFRATNKQPKLLNIIMFKTSIRTAAPRTFSPLRFTHNSQYFKRLQSSYSKIKKISNIEEYNKQLGSTNLSVFDFYATWCGPCKAMAPHLSKMVETYSEPKKVNFFKIDIDENPEIARAANITAVPTFVLNKNNQNVDTIVGADPNKLQKSIDSNA